MKKISLLLVIVFLAFSTMAWAEAPAPFEYIKGYAMDMVTPDSDGDYIVNIELNDNGQLVRFAFGYLVEAGIIAIGKEGLGFIIYNEKDKSFGRPYGSYLFRLEEEKAIEMAYVIFRELLERNLLQRKI